MTTILMVEDNEAILSAEEELLPREGYDVIAVTSAEEALQTLQERQDIDLIFSDVRLMGAMDGIKLAEEVARQYPDKPVVLTTAYSEAIEAGENRWPVIHKPYRVEDLTRVFRRTLRQA